MAITFDHEETAYLAWLRANPVGYVVNRRREHDPTYLKLHRPTCPHISTHSQGNFTTTAYLKVCSHNLDELQRWARMQIGGSLDPACSCNRQPTSGRVPAPTAGSAEEADERWSLHDLQRKLDEFEQAMRSAGRSRSYVYKHVSRAERFVRWLVGDYRPLRRIEDREDEDDRDDGESDGLSALAAAVYAELRDLVPHPGAKITYGTLVARLPSPWKGEIDARSPDLARALGEIQLACRRRGLPLITAIVVRSGYETPGGGFYAMAYPSITEEAEQLVAWEREVARVRETHYPESLT